MLEVMVTWTTGLLQNAADMAQVVAHISLPDSRQVPQVDPTIPNPGDGAEPPGATGFLRILKWGLWAALFVCVAGFITIGARMGIKHQKGEGGGHMASLALVGFGCVIIVIANVIVEQIVSAT